VGVEGSGGAAFIGGNGSDDTINFFPKAEADPFDAIQLKNKEIDYISTIRNMYFY
jgi:hypothetical protein